jgi:hypothetical protein
LRDATGFGTRDVDGRIQIVTHPDRSPYLDVDAIAAALGPGIPPTEAQDAHEDRRHQSADTAHVPIA